MSRKKWSLSRRHKLPGLHTFLFRKWGPQTNLWKKLVYKLFIRKGAKEKGVGEGLERRLTFFTRCHLYHILFNYKYLIFQQ